MFLELRKRFLALFLIVLLISQMVNTTAVFADGDTPPTDPAPQEITDPAVTPEPNLENDSSDANPPQPSTTLESTAEDAPAEADSLSVTPEASAQIPDDTQTDQPSSDDSSSADSNQPADLPEILAQIPDTTQVILINSDGQPEPMATVTGVEILTHGDPMWCPEGVLPGGVGCTASFSSFTGASGLLNTLSGGAYSGNGVIYVAENYDSSLESGDIDIDGSVLTTLQKLKIQGGWDFGVNSVTGTSMFDGVSLNIYNWNYDVAVNDVEITNTSLDGLSVQTSGSIAVNNVDAHDNFGSGVFLDSTAGTGNVTVTDSTFENNGGDGVTVLSSAGIELNDVTANDNDGNGAYLETCGCNPGDINVNGGEFSSNGLDGINAFGDGSININGAEADDNDYTGFFITSGGDVNITNSGAGANGEDGFNIDSLGDVKLNGVNSGYNNQNGVSVVANGNVSVMDTWLGLNDNAGLVLANGGNVNLIEDAFFDNTFVGAAVISGGAVNVAKSFFGNCFLSSALCGGQQAGGIFQTYGSVNIEDSQFNQNGSVGLLVTSDDNVSLTNVTADGNGDMGAIVNAINNVTVCGGSFSNNGDTGLTISASGVATISSSTVFVGNGTTPTDITAADVVTGYNCSPRKGSGAGGGAGQYHIVNVSGGESVALDCSAYVGTMLILPNGSRILLPCPIHDTGKLTSIDTDHLPGALPGGFNLVSGLEGLVLFEGQVVEQINDGAMTVSFPVENTGDTYTILYWDSGKWAELPTQAGSLHDPNDGALILTGVHTADGFVSTTVNFTGIFVLVKK